MKKLRRQGATTYALANTYLETTHTAEHNRRFAITPAARKNFHLRRAARALARTRCFACRKTATLSNDGGPV